MYSNEQLKIVTVKKKIKNFKKIFKKAKQISVFIYHFSEAVRDIQRSSPHLLVVQSHQFFGLAGQLLGKGSSVFFHEVEWLLQAFQLD